MAEKKSGIDQKLIRDLANILNDTDLTEIEVEQDDLRIRVSRNGTPVMMPQQMQGYAYQAPAAPAAAPAPARSGGSDGNAAPVYRGPSVRVTRGKETEETAVSAKANGTAILSSQSSGVRRAGHSLPAAGATVIN